MNKSQILRTLTFVRDVIRQPSEVRAATVGRIYVLHQSKEGKQVGDWITPDADPDILDAQIRDATQQPETGTYGYTVTKYDNFPDLGKGPKVKAIAEVVSLLQKHDAEVVSAALAMQNNSVEQAKLLLDEGYSVHNDDEDYAYSVVDDLGGPENLGPQTLLAYFDFKKYGQDLMLEVLNSDLKNGRVVVFNRKKT